MKYNTPIELATRSALILIALESELSIDDLVALDYALLYSNDFGGPNNLHPSLPNHIAEITHRREYLPHALNLFVKRGLIELKHNKNGHYYSANSNTRHYISCLKSSYYKKTWKILSWIKENTQKIINKPLYTYQASQHDN